MVLANTMASVTQNPREIASEVCVSPRLQASLTLDFARDEFARHTVLVASRQEPPLKVVRAFAVQDGAALAHLHNVSGGLLGGDRLALQVNVGARSSVQLTTTGATRIYRPRREALPRRNRTNSRCSEGALLEYVPDAIIPYRRRAFLANNHDSPGAGRRLVLVGNSSAWTRSAQRDHSPTIGWK